MDHGVGKGAYQIPSLSEDDRRLILGFLSGDPGAVEVIDGWVEVVLRTGFRALREDWDDVRQEVRVRVLANLRAERFHGASELRTYVHRIAKNTAIDRLRAVARRNGRLGPTPRAEEFRRGVADGQAALMSKDLLAKIMAGLTLEERGLLEMVHGRHLSYAEIARAMGVAEGTIKARVFRCREHLIAVRRRLLERRPS